MDKNIFLGIGIGALASSVVTFVLTKLVLDKKFQTALDEGLERVRTLEDKELRLMKEGPYSSPEAAMDKIMSDNEDIIEEAQYDTSSEAVEDGHIPSTFLPPVDISEMVSAPSLEEHIEYVDEFDQEDEEEEADEPLTHLQDALLVGSEERELRSSDRPYIISELEYGDLEGYEMFSLAYYEGDDTLADERESIIPDPAHIVGYENLSRFGQFSSNPDIVYVRNEKLETDFEIVRDERGYTEVVAGIKDFQASKTQIRKMREDD